MTSKRAKLSKSSTGDETEPSSDSMRSTSIRDAETVPDLSDDAWQVLEDCVEAFEAAWRQGGKSPNIDDFLLQDDPTQGQLLIELVLVDLELRLGRDGYIGIYLERYPELTNRPGMLTALRQAERRLIGGREFSASSETIVVAAPGPARLPQLEGYVLEREIGRGGMGIVYLAKDLALNRQVAIKTLLPGATAEERRRLRREAEGAARIDHPNVAKVFQAIESDELLLMILEYLPGETLAERLDGMPWSPAAAAELVETLCGAVAAAHRLGIVHRDLKPANILYTADDVPKIADFGLMKLLDDTSERTRTEVIAGSPGYMAPEQAISEKKTDTAVDVWALGVILYELLTGRLPFRDATILGTLELIRSANPVAPGRLIHRMPRDLNTICLHCLEKAPEKRYASVAEMGADLARFRRGEPVQARPLGRVEHLRRWAAKNVALSVLVLLLVLSLVGGTLVSATAAIKASRAADLAKHNAHQARQSQHAERQALQTERQTRRELEKILFATKLRNAHAALGAGNPKLAADLLARIGRDTRHQYSFVINYLDRLIRPPGRTIDHFDEAAYFVRISPDGKLLAACGAGGTVRFYQTGNWEPAGRIVAGQGELNGLCFSAGGGRIATTGDDGSVVLWEMPNSRETGDQETGAREIWRRQVFDKGIHGFDVEFVLEDEQLAVCGGHTIVLLDAATGESVGRLEGHTDLVQAMVVTPDGRSLISTGDDRLTFNWNLTTGEPRWRVQASSKVGKCHTLVLADEGQRIVLGSLKSVVMYLATATGKQLFQSRVVTHRLTINTGLGIRSIALVGEDEHPVVIFEGGTVMEVVPSGNAFVPVPQQPRSVWHVPQLRVRTMISYHGGQSLITASDAGFIDIWQRRAAAAWRNVPIAGVRGCAWIRSPELGNRLLVATSPGHGGGCWSIDPLTCSKRSLVKGPFTTIRATPNGSFVVLVCNFDRLASNRGGRIAAYDFSGPEPKLLWETSSTRVLPALIGPEFHVEDAAFTIATLPDTGRRVYFIVRALDAANVAQTAIFSLSRATGKLLAFRDLDHFTPTPTISPDGETLVAGADYIGKIFWMDPADFSIRETGPGHSFSNSAFCFCPKGKWLATTGADLEIHLWRDGKLLHNWHTETGRVEHLEFSPDGDLLVSSSYRDAPRIWDVATRQLLLEPGRYPSRARGSSRWTPARFSPDGNWLAVAHDAMVTFFDGRPYPNTIEPVE